MRFTAALISTQLLASAVSAETLPDKVVSVLKDVCVTPTSSEAMLAAGEKLAAAENWKLVRSGPAPVPIMHNEKGEKVAFESVWELDGLKLYVSILRPSIPGFRYDLCMVAPDADIDVDHLSQAIHRKFGSALTSDKRYRVRQSWLFTDEKVRGNCGKQIYFPRSSAGNAVQSIALFFSNVAYPDDPQWDTARADFTRCPVQ